MPKQTGIKSRNLLNEMRQRAEAAKERLQNEQLPNDDDSLVTDALRLSHELQVYQIELEMQHEELERSTNQIRLLLAEYSSLYDFAPIGYFTIGLDGAILRANLTGAKLLGVERSKLAGLPFRRFVASESRTSFAHFLSDLAKDSADQVCVLSLKRKNQAQLFVQVNASATETPGVFRMTVTDITDRRALEFQRSQQAERINDLSHSLVRLQEHERRKLGTELHDRTSGNLAALTLLLKDLGERMPPAVYTELAPQMEDITALLEETTHAIREISSSIRPPLLDHCGLIPALEDYVAKFIRHAGITVAFAGNLHQQLEAEMESALFRIVQEALTNCAKHSHASHVSIALDNPADRIVLSITDDGYGFQPEAIFGPGSQPGLGIISMKERAEFAGGEFRIKSLPGKGTRITVVFKRSPGEKRGQWFVRKADRRKADVALPEVLAEVPATNELL